ncbi:uncharacterized protein LACBIDRAFT_300092 [Laccaria bicolor S238N-H82]|uniref:Predicted protein n=1 Tax=Laccaria bicolor (strain S238N-H82 / ATCC MYA-4686) TaxID=486041 RepID=B0DG04_LACBS|nr:uncharacterized protein LACBIDRAFT_300092 [Laccaria bicolor S238N-H82]EDR06554.1 predicted protein [Laccaria bicolor S238N-H82]|eukprot:XP_001882926.1 predicted protein [Laccaria bicolor S238N-H82]
MPPKKKVKRNISGLRNQSKPTTGVSHTDSEPICGPRVETSHTPDLLIDNDLDDVDDEEWVPNVHVDSSRPVCDGVESDGDIDSEDEEDFLDKVEEIRPGVNPRKYRNKGLYVALMRMAMDVGDNLMDEDWVPKKTRKKLRKERKIANRPKEYKKGPDVGSKSTRTQCRYKSLLKDQKTLEDLGFTKTDKRPCIDHEDNMESDSGQSDSSGFGEDTFEVDTIKQESPELEIPLERDAEIVAEEDAGENDIQIRIESASPPRLMFDDETPADVFCDLVQIREESMSPPRLLFDDQISLLGKRKNGCESNPENSADPHHAAQKNTDDLELADEEWEAELDECFASNPSEIRDWHALRDQIKNDLNKKFKSLPLSQINQLMILRNFATLRLKGLGRIEASKDIAKQWHQKLEGSSDHFARRIRALARHYQIFEQLPRERRGGQKNSRSILKNEAVRRASRAWLIQQQKGKVTPVKFQKGLNESILPSLGIYPNKPLCERTARRWLVKLGWHRTRIKKGVYVDGHERADVVSYRQNIFLPKMAEFESRMARYERIGDDLQRISPLLQLGEKEIIPEFHDESSFHAFEHTASVWLHSTEQIIPKKDRGRLIHISEYIEAENGRLVVNGPNGEVLKEARQIIYPGSNGDPWWDSKQLIDQVKNKAIPVFEEAHPGCQALFIYDQSSAHAALAPDALKAFEMNKSNGGAQRRQKDTIIPDSNPFPEYRGRIQKMTTETGQQKGLQQTLEERGFDVRHLRAKCAPVCPFENENCCMARLLSKQEDFANQISVLETVIREAGHECIFLPKFHCELNPIEMYWGWAKYRYRQVDKNTFQQAKDAASEALNACPPEVIWRFINRSWRWMSAYRIGLTGEAAQWAVRKQKGHRSVSRTAMMHLDSVLN